MAVREGKEQDPRIPRIASSIRVVPDFPKKGIMFQDITTLLLDPKAFKDTVDLFVERYTGRDISVVAGEFFRLNASATAQIHNVWTSGGQRMTPCRAHGFFLFAESVLVCGGGVRPASADADLAPWSPLRCKRLFRFGSCLSRSLSSDGKALVIFHWILFLDCETGSNMTGSKTSTKIFSDGFCGHVLGVEARGFIFGPPIALAIGAKFVPLRKPKKLPGEVISENYVLEYGTDCLEMHVGAVQPGERALVVDDLVATGGTLCAAISLLERAGAEVVECACVIELPELKGRERLNGKNLYILMESH
ncbi:hypothetical protein ZIOFF_064277 [Zingiber officinale]|uniref:adenine phosphoribosyltransferase n=1 Tax=Zingiber officinale TaxID=94328 RepID=A0A8J5EVW1_ZINOF|nr:hypothetical protein ZIOFF_064277 [Zingiber officinale]